jgi:hypothetical protein
MNRILFLILFFAVGAAVFFRSLGPPPSPPFANPTFTIESDPVAQAIHLGQTYIGPWLEALICLSLLSFLLRQKTYPRLRRLLSPLLFILWVDLLFKTFLSFGEAQRIETQGAYSFVGLPFDLRQYPLQSVLARRGRPLQLWKASPRPSPQFERLSLSGLRLDLQWSLLWEPFQIQPSESEPLITYQFFRAGTFLEGRYAGYDYVILRTQYQDARPIFARFARKDDLLVELTDVTAKAWRHPEFEQHLANKILKKDTAFAIEGLPPYFPGTALSHPVVLGPLTSAHPGVLPVEIKLNGAVETFFISNPGGDGHWEDRFAFSENCIDERCLERRYLFLFLPDQTYLAYESFLPARIQHLGKEYLRHDAARCPGAPKVQGRVTRWDLKNSSIVRSDHAWLQNYHASLMQKPHCNPDRSQCIETDYGRFVSQLPALFIQDEFKRLYRYDRKDLRDLLSSITKCDE